jgi:hypothetical protein
MGKFDFLNLSGEYDAEAFMEKQKKYACLKRDELDDIPEHEIVSAVTGWIEGKFAEDWSDMCEKINSLPTPCLNVYCAGYVANEVRSGGFAQAFFNTSRDYIGAAANGFRAIGYGEAADVIESALKIHYDSDNKPSGRSIDDFVFFTASGEYEDSDRKFCDVFDEEKFGRLVKSYVLAYKKYFGD